MGYGTDVIAETGIGRPTITEQTPGELTPGDGNILFVADNTNTATVETHTAQYLELDLTPRFNETIVPGSVSFKLGGQTYYDNGGRLFYKLNVATGQGINAGNINYRTGKVRITAWEPGVAANFKLISLLTTMDKNVVSQVCFRLPAAPTVPQSFQLLGTTLDGTDFSVVSDADGKLTDPALKGFIDVQAGLVAVFFGEKVVAAGNEAEPWYDASLVDADGNIWKPKQVFVDGLKYNATAYTTVPLNSDLLGIETTRLPLDGRVTIFRPGDMIVVGSRFKQDLGTAFNPGQAVQLNETGLDMMCLMDKNNKHVLAEKYDYDLVLGTITFKDPLDLSDYEMPLFAKYAKEENKQISQVDIDGTLSLTKGLIRDYNPLNTYVSSANNAGDLQVRATKPFSQQIWTNEWSNQRIGDPILAQLNTKDFPIELTDKGAIKARWAIICKSSSTFELYEEFLGLVAFGDMTTDLMPANPAGGYYFILRAGAWGAGGAQVGNVFRFNTHSALIGDWIIRAVQQSNDVYPDVDGATLAIRGNTIEE